jgi:type VI secretion system protein ImpC
VSAEKSALSQPALGYDIQRNWQTLFKEIPFVIGVIADLSGPQADPLRAPDKRFVSIDRGNFDFVLAATRPRLMLRSNNVFFAEDNSAVEISFESIADFEPGAILDRWVPLTRLVELRKTLVNLLERVKQDRGLEHELVRALRKARQPGSTDLQGEIGRLLGESDGAPAGDSPAAFSARMLALPAVEEHLVGKQDLTTTLEAVIALVQQAIFKELIAVLHAPEFRELEATWRGLHYLVCQSETNECLKIRVLNAAKRGLGKELRKFEGWRFDQSPLCKAMFTQALGQYGGEAFDCFVVAYEFSRSRQDFALLQNLSNIAVLAAAPIITAAHPSFGLLESWGALHQLTGGIGFTDPDNEPWWTFGYSDGARHVVMTLPRFLLRIPYSVELNPSGVDDFEEVVGSPKDYVWGNPAFALASALASSFSCFRDFRALNDSRGATEVLGIVSHERSTIGGFEQIGPVETDIPRKLQTALFASGFSVLRSKPATDSVECTPRFFFRSAVSEHSNDGDEAQPKDGISLEAKLLVGRLEHCIYALLVTKGGSWRSRDECERGLRAWLARYVGSPRQGFWLRTAHASIRATSPNGDVYRLYVDLGVNKSEDPTISDAVPCLPPTPMAIDMEFPHGAADWDLML